jgi:hypothetical protein
MWELVVELFLRDDAYYSWQTRPEAQTAVPWFHSVDENHEWQSENQDYIRWLASEPPPVEFQTEVTPFDDEQSCLRARARLSSLSSAHISGGGDRLVDQPPGWDVDWSINYVGCEQPFDRGPMWAFTVSLIYGSPPDHGHFRWAMWAYESQQECEIAWNDWRSNVPSNLAMLAQNNIVPDVFDSERESWESPVCWGDLDSPTCGVLPICEERWGVPSGSDLISLAESRQ